MKNFNQIAIFKTILMLLFASFFVNAQAQYQMENSGFETFETGYNKVGQQPVGWYGSNVNKSVVTKQLVSSESNGRTGKCVYLHNEFVGVGNTGAPANAYISLGEPWNEIEGVSSTKAIGGCERGFPFTYRPDTLEIWVKRTFVSQEHARIVIYLWKGTTLGSSYRNKEGNCQPVKDKPVREDEESDVRGTNTCTTTQRATLIGEGEWVCPKEHQLPNWTLVKVPVTYRRDDIPEKINIMISAANSPAEGQANTFKEGSKLWADDLRLIYSSKVHKIGIDINGDGNFRSLPNFDENTLEYSYEVKEGATSVPNIQVYRSGRQLSGSEVTIINGTIDGAPTTITVRAEDGSSTTTYIVNFATELSSNPQPENILINGEPLQDCNGQFFNGYVKNYNVTLPYGTTECPEISVEKADDKQSYSIINCASLPDTAKVKVTSADGNYSNIYRINFSVMPFSNNTLQNILIDGEPLPNFAPLFNNYTIELPSSTTQPPTITPVSEHQNLQTITVDNSAFPAPSTIKVFPDEMPNVVRTYKIRYDIILSDYAFLNNIKIDGVSLENFSSDRLSYDYVLPRNTTELPEITYEKGEENQSVNIVSNGVNGATLIYVAAENGNRTVYRINFSVFKSENSRLNNIDVVGGQISPNFHPDTLSYNVKMPSGTTTMPLISYLQGDDYQNVRINYGKLNELTTIRVLAENTNFNTVYSLKISSVNSHLNAILLDGEALDGFSPEILNYNYILPATATASPQIDVVKVSDNQQVFIEKPALTGLAVIRVISETADVENIYTINFQYQFSDNNFLDSIKIDGEILAEFNPATTSYTIDLQRNIPAPAVEYFASDSTSKIFAVDNSLRGMDINVTAQNGATRTYSINYNIPPTNNTDLADIEIWENAVQNFVSLANFDAQTTEYEYLLAWRTNNVPAINPVASESGQVITIFYNSVNDTTEIQVVAPNGINQKSYFIYFPVEKSDYCFLSSITINGAEIADFPPNQNFNPQNFTYNIALPYGTTQTPQVIFEKGKIDNQTIFEQNIEATAGNLNEPYTLKVTAENGATQTYTLNFSIDMSGRDGENYLNNIFLNGIPVENFDRETFEYNVILPCGTTELPEISFTKNNLEQTIATDVSGVFGTAKIKVFSNIIGVATNEYRINFSVADISTATLNSISFNGIAFNNFDPKVHSYIVPVTAQPAYSYTYNQNKLLVNETFFNHKKLVLEVSNKSDENDKNTYTFWFYYTNDVIPNASFESWSDMEQASGIKPTFWTCQGDVRSSVGNFNLQNQVQRSDDHTHGNYSVLMKGEYNSSTTADENGLITLGGVTSTGGTLGFHSTAVTGGIDFRNTPDFVKMDYKYSRAGLLNPSMYFAFRMWNLGENYSAGESVATIIDADGTTRNDWYAKSYNITYTGNYRYPKRLNIVLSSNDSENSYFWPTGKRGELWVDNLILGYNSKLSDISVNGATISGFSPENYAYSVTISPESMGKPVISIGGQVPDQEHRITVSDENASRERTATIISKAEDNTVSTYTITIFRPVAAVNTLAGISIGGNPIADFTPNTFEYNVFVPSGTLYPPDILATKGEGHQNISYIFGNDNVTIKVTAENGNLQSYVVNFVEQISDNTTLQNIEVVGYDINFNSQTTEYQVILPTGTQNIPQIFFTKQNEGQKVILTTSSANGTSVVRVEAQNGVNFTDYKIHFSTLPPVTSHLLSRISLENIPINNFTPTTFNYNVHVDENSKFVFEKEFAADTMNVVYFDDSIKCYIGENTYKIVFRTVEFNNAFLVDIAVNYSSISNYQLNQFTYSVDWNENNLPYITVKSAVKGQTITCFWRENSIKISVTAPDGITKNEYIVNFIPQNALSNSLLSNILIDGISLEDFVSNDFDYTLELPNGITYIPVIQAVKGEQHQTVEITTNGINNTTTILVTAQDGVTQSTYTIIFTSRLSDNALLTEILINGVLIDNFVPEILIYNHTFPHTATDFTVDYAKAHAGQNIAVENNGIFNNYKITVTSESGNFTNQYIINFNVEPSPYAYLESIFSDGILIQNFFPEALEYKLILPYGTQNVPNITYISGNIAQNIILANAATLNDTTFISITAENGVNQNIYKISFETILLNNALLDNIFINGEPLRTDAANFTADKDFNSQISDYEVILPFSTTEFPAVGWIGQVADYHSINFINNGFDDISVIEIISQNQRVINEYSIKFAVALSSNSALRSISLNGKLLSGFNSEILHYTIEYPIGTQISEIINSENAVGFVKGDEHQNVAVNIEDDNTIVIIVTAQNGSWRVYVIEQIILKSSNAFLADIVIGNEPLRINANSFHADKNFDPNIFEYEITLPFKDTDILNFDGIKQEEGQTIECIKKPIDYTSTIIVTAEDGKMENIYKIKFVNSGISTDAVPTKENTCFTLYDGICKFTTNRNNVSVLIFDLMGRLVFNSNVQLTIPENNLCESEIGVTFQNAKKGQIYIYMFLHNSKTKIDGASGKFFY